MTTTSAILRFYFKRWLAAGCKTYGKSDEEIAGRLPTYVDLLKDIPIARLAEACEKCAQTCSDFPAVADVRQAATEATEALRTRLRATGESDGSPTLAIPGCSWCDGTGWAPVERNGVTGARRCACVAGKALPPDGGELKKIAAPSEFAGAISEAAERRKM